jgi:RNA polymerase-binding transcription factor DksA
MATKKPVAKNAKSAPKKAVAKTPAKPVAKKPVAKAAPKPAPKKVAAKPAAKPAPKKAAPKKAAKPVAKPTAKPMAKKATPKAPVKAVSKAPAKPVAKAPAKPVAKAPAKPVAKAPAKPAAKAPTKPVAKAPAKPVAKVQAKPVAKAPVKPVAKEVVKKETPKVEPRNTTTTTTKSGVNKAGKKSGPTKTIITSSFNNLPKKSDVFKTNTFGTPNLKNDTGKVIAHRKTSELKRKTEDTLVKKYEPESTRSILDMGDTKAGPSYRYSDEDLQEFRELIQRKLETAKAELQYLQGVIMRKDEGGTEDTENKYQNMEDGSASMEREQFTQLASRQITFISHLEQAMVRIENKTYGICRETGKLIDKARLRAVPHATLSIEAKNAKKN